MEAPAKTITNSDPAVLSPRRLFVRRFFRHKLAVASVGVLSVLYLVAIFAEFVSVNDPNAYHIDYAYAPPTPITWSWSDGLHATALVKHVDPVTLQRTYQADAESTLPVRLLVASEPYYLAGFIPMKHRLLGTSSDAPLLVLGADKYGRDVFSRIVVGSRISLSIGLVGVALTFVLGISIGGLSGYAGGRIDTFIQRVIEIVSALPQLPLWLALAAVFPPEWSSVSVFFAITVALSLLNWPPLARVVRGKILALREEDYAVAARLLGMSHCRVLFRHLIPGFTSHLIVAVTLTIPVMILGETSLSFLGLGLRPPVVSWGVMLQDCLDVKAVRFYPWLLSPVVFIVLAVLAFNFLGDGIRDAADPHGEGA
ncbi:MAG: ABC transporter permease [Planctomycetota bacterium]